MNLSEESIIPAKEWIIHSLERFVPAKEWMNLSLERFVPSKERMFHSVERSVLSVERMNFSKEKFILARAPLLEVSPDLGVEELADDRAVDENRDQPVEVDPVGNQSRE